VVPFQVNVSQTDRVVVEVLLRLIVRFSVAVLSQPNLFVVLNVYVPELV